MKYVSTIFTTIWVVAFEIGLWFHFTNSNWEVERIDKDQVLPKTECECTCHENQYPEGCVNCVDNHNPPTPKVSKKKDGTATFLRKNGYGRLADIIVTKGAEKKVIDVSSFVEDKID